MYVVIVEFSIHPGTFASFLTRVRRQAADSLDLEAECHVFDVCVSAEKDDFVLLYEVYSDREAFEAHLESEHFQDFDTTARDWVSEKKVTILERV